MRDEFVKALTNNQPAFGLVLRDRQIRHLADYFDLVREHNPLLHLIAPCSPEEFAARHILESLTLLELLPEEAAVADVGSGAGLPSIPCLLVREDLRAVLIESKEKKAAFLEVAVKRLSLTVRAIVENKQFAEVKDPDFSFVTCRALDKFVDHLPRLLRWAKDRKLLLFGGPNLEEALVRNRASIDERRLMPLSEQRYLFSVSAATR